MKQVKWKRLASWFVSAEIIEGGNVNTVEKEAENRRKTSKTGRWLRKLTFDGKISDQREEKSGKVYELEKP